MTMSMGATDMGAYTDVQRAVPTRTQAAPEQILSAIRHASARTGIDFAYLVQQANAESSFNTHAQAKTSSAKGLYQFIDQTWLNMVATHGQKHGLGHYAAMIDRHPDRTFDVHDPAMKQRILDLRTNPQIASVMAAEFAADNKAHLERNTNATIGKTELYLAHFLGAQGAAKFLNTDNNALGKDVFPAAAKANKNVFYDPATGQPRSLKQIHAFFDKKFGAIDIQVARGHTTAPITPAPMPSPDMITDDLLRLNGEQYAQMILDMTYSGTRSGTNGFGYTNMYLDPVSILILSSLNAPGDDRKTS